MPATNPSEPSAGRRFELVRTLGVGSFGTVYLAEMESAGGFRRRVALKVLNPTWDQGATRAPAYETRRGSSVASSTATSCGWMTCSAWTGAGRC